MDKTLSPGYGPIVALIAVIAVSAWLGVQAQRAVQRGSFLKGYFLGNRGLGAWALALTATVQSGGTFMGFPSLVYTYGWIVALWIGSYMVVPITGFAVLGKRFAQLSRRTGAITVPDLLRERFASPAIGLVASLAILFFVAFTMVAQFKAGAIVMKIVWPGTGVLALSEDSTGGVDKAYLIALGIFSVTVVSYTMIGGFLASVWTDLFQSVLMAVGVMILFALVVPGASLPDRGEPTRKALESVGPAYVFGPGAVTKSGDPWLPLGMAFSYFVVWVFGGVGAPAGMVRLMACKDSATMRRSIVLLSCYNLLIYLPLIVICIAARSQLPDLGTRSDEVIPRLAISSTSGWGFAGSLLAGLILTAPFGAIMASVSSFLVLMASGIVRDVYQRFLRPHAEEREIRLASYGVMAALGVVGFVANLEPVEFLQSLIIFSGTASAATFIAPAVMAAYWRRGTASGALCAMLAGAGTIVALSLRGLNQPFLGLHPVIYGLSLSAATAIIVSLFTTPPPDALVRKLFDAEPTPAPRG